LIWKSVGVLLGAVALIVLGVVGLARLTVPDEPTFAEGLEEGDGEGFLDVAPIAIGGQLEVSGAREGTIVIDQNVNGPSYGLGNSKTRIFFEGSPLTVSQMSHDGLSFFPEPEECEFTTGAQNEGTGITAVQISCPELVDIRGNGTLAVEGYLALPTGVVMALDVPDSGGALMVGDEEWVIPPDVILFVGEAFFGGEPGFQLTEENLAGSMFIGHDPASDTLFVRGMANPDGELTEVPPDACTVSQERVMVVSPDMEAFAVGISCEEIEVPGMGLVPVEGSVVLHKIQVADP
jgi:hypothetical protein